MDVARRLKVGLAAFGALLAVAAFAATPALADTQPDPTESNIPYLLWRGQEVRLVKCHPSLAGATSASVVLEDWSGEEHALAVPQFEGGGFLTATGPDHNGQRCVTVDFTSQKAGIAVIKMIAYGPSPGVTGAPIPAVSNTAIVGATGTPILKHQWLVAWMNLNTPVLSASNAGSTGPGPITTNPADLIDVAGTGRNNFRVDVTGNIPLRANFRELGLGDTLTMPNDWPRLAERMAAYFNPDNPAVPFTWDIHDDRTTDTIHGAPTQVDFYCTANSTTATTDAVDNCPQFLLGPDPDGAGPLPAPFVYSQGETGAFSRIWSFPTSPTIGPFDPLVPRQTLLSDGRLNAEDAPMPEARIDFTTSGGGFWGCVGTTVVPGNPGCSVLSNTCAQPPFQGPNCQAKDKHVLYSRDGLGGKTNTVAGGDAHNLYAPFYARFIPATSRSCNPATLGCNGLIPAGGAGIVEASGSLGPAGSVIGPTDQGPGVIGVPGGTNNFNGYLINGLYHYWDVVRVLSEGAGASSGCLLRFNTTFTPGPTGLVVTRTPIFRPLSLGPQTVVVYTDEHGEAHAWWYPGRAFPFGNLGIAGNLNLGCDLQGVNPIARPNIQAIARYPYQPVTDPPKVSNTLQKTVNSLFNKILRCVPKGTAPNDQFAQVCLLEARDITGSPALFAGEIVCFASNAELIQHFTGNAGPVLGGGGVNVQGTLLTPAEVAALGKSGAAVLCQRLDINGRAAVEVFGKGPSNLIADLVDQGLIRVVTFNFASGTGATGTETTSTASTVTPAVASSVNNSDTTVQTQSGQTIATNGGQGTAPEVKPPAATKPAIQAKLVLAQLMRPVNAKAYLKVRVNSNAATAKIRIKMVGAKSTVSTVDRVVKTNRVVNVKGLKIAQSVVTLRVSVVS